MGMTLRKKRHDSIKALERKIRDGWQPKNDGELKDAIRRIVAVNMPKDVLALAKLLLENPEELGSDEVVEAIHRNITRQVENRVVQRYREIEKDMEEARLEYEARQQPKPVKA